VDNRVEGEVDGAVGQGLNQILLVEGQFGSQAKRSRASPFLQPVDGIDQLVVQGLIIALEVLLDMIQHSLLPILVGIVDVPLVARLDDTDISRTRDNMTIGFVVDQSFSFVDHFLLHHILGISHL
jgi:hypothetical protein